MKKRTLLKSLLISYAVLMTGCGVMKDREDRVVIAHENPSIARGRQSGGTVDGSDPQDEALLQIRQFLDLYTRNGALTRDGLAHFIEKYKDKIGPFLSGMGLTSQELIDLLFRFDDNQDLHLSPEELAEGLKKRIPVLRWIPDNGSAITRRELGEQIALEYPQANETARQGLADALMRFDARYNEGNDDGMLSRAEVSGAGLVMSVIAQTDFSQGIVIPPGAGGNPPSSGVDLSPVVGKLIGQKLDQQLFSRYPVASAKALSAQDLRLEWMQLALKFFAIDKLVHHFGSTQDPNRPAAAGRVSESQAAIAFSAWGIRHQPHWGPLRKVYDSGFMGGEADGWYTTIEAFNYLTDLELARSVHALVGGGRLSAKEVSAKPQAKQALVELLARLLPRTGKALILETEATTAQGRARLRSDYWDWLLGYFDDSFRGGNENDSFDSGEVAMVVAYAKMMENLYELFDSNHDGYLERAEGNRMFETFGITDYRVIDAFYANVGLNTGAPGFWARLKLFFGGDRGWKRLRPIDFHIRMVQVLPRLIDRQGDEE